MTPSKFPTLLRLTSYNIYTLHNYHRIYQSRRIGAVDHELPKNTREPPARPQLSTSAARFEQSFYLAAAGRHELVRSQARCYDQATDAERDFSSPAQRPQAYYRPDSAQRPLPTCKSRRGESKL
jgi:hypothetical protein